MSNVEQVLAGLEGRYQQSPSLRAAWADEEGQLREILQSIADQLARNYELIEALGVGGSGVVLKVRDTRLEIDRAIKFPRPSPGKQQLLGQFLRAETDRMVELSHPYLMRVHDRGVCIVDDVEVPFYVMDLYVGVDDSDDYLAGPEINEQDILETLERSLEALAYMHGEGQVHLDIKPGNILVRPGNAPVLSDLGFAKLLQDESGLTIIGGTEGFIHPDARRFIVEASSDPNRLRGEAQRRKLEPAWDLYSMGKTFLRLLEVIEARNDFPLSLYTHRYLKLMACRLLDGQNSMRETLLGLSQSALEEIKYKSANEALVDIRKLTGNYSLEARIPELDPFGSDTIQASTFATTRFTPRVKALVEHPEVARLGGFTQLSLLNLVYPTATHTRLEHVIGAYSALARYIVALYRDPINPLFRQIMNEDDIRAALVVPLVHDVGHFALAHDLEEADAAIFSHEERGKALLQDSSTGLRSTIESDQLPDGSPGWSVPIERLLSILNADVSTMKGSLKDRLIHSLIDGPIDADKLDYIIRDSVNLGLSYGSVIDVERLLRVLTVVSRQSGSTTHVNLGIHEKGRVTAEAVAFARYALYGSVYWHHSYRSVKAMLCRIAWEYLESVDRKDEQKKEGISKAVRRELYPFLRAEGGGAPQTLPLTQAVSGGQLHPGDKAVLEWFGQRSGPVGSALVEQIEGRRLFKRVLVVSRWGNESLWRSISALMSGHDWRAKLKFQREFQLFLSDAVQSVDAVDARTTMIVADARNEFITAARLGLPIVMVDGTQARPGASSGLELVREEDRRRARIDEIPTGTEESQLWDSLRTNLHESLGKVRVLCHPDHSRFVSALGRGLVEDALDRALRSANS